MPALNPKHKPYADCRLRELIAEGKKVIELPRSQVFFKRF